MKAITLWQPWASLLACGEKQYETRSWETKYRGPIAIHAAKIPFSTGAYIDRELHRYANALGLKDIHSFDTLPYGRIIAIAELVNCWHIVYHPGLDVDRAKHIPIGAELDVPRKHPDFGRYIVPTDQEMFFGNWTPGRYAWEFKNMIILNNPIPAKGMQMLWNWVDKPGEGSK